MRTFGELSLPVVASAIALWSTMPFSSAALSHSLSREKGFAQVSDNLIGSTSRNDDIFHARLVLASGVLEQGLGNALLNAHTRVFTELLWIAITNDRVLERFLSKSGLPRKSSAAQAKEVVKPQTALGPKTHSAAEVSDSQVLSKSFTAKPGRH